MADGRSVEVDPLVPSQLRSLLRRHGFRPRQRLGQTFLIDRNTAQKVVRAAGLSGQEDVVEIGAGAGAVTGPLADAARRVIAVEIDPGLVAMLRETVGHGAEIVQADLLALEWADLLGADRHGGWRLVGNLPYAISGPAIVKLLDGAEWFGRMVIMVQEEVGARLLAAAGSRHRGQLTVLVESVADVSLVGRVPRTCFFPRPRVDSAILALDVRRPAIVPPELARCFREVVRAAFSSRRKMLANALSHAYGGTLPKEEASQMLSQCGIEPSRRAETLSVDEFLLIATGLAADRMDAAQ